MKADLASLMSAAVQPPIGPGQIPMELPQIIAALLQRGVPLPVIMELMQQGNAK